MDCPVCHKAMKEQDFGGIKVDVCVDGCKGMWFGWLELEKLDQSKESFGELLKQALASPRTQDENRGQIKCPRCATPMVTHPYKSAKNVNVDECYGCAGFFLDPGELKALRASFMNEKQREEYLDKILKMRPGLSPMEEKKDENRSNAVKKFSQLFKSIDDIS